MSSTSENLESFPVFAAFPRDALARLASIAEARAVTAGEIIFREGDASTDIFFVLDGEIEFLFAAAGADGPKGTSAKRGQMFGDIAFVEDTRRSATARATTEARLLCLSRTALRSLPDHAALELELTREIAKTLAVRLKAENTNLIAYYEREREARALQHAFGQFFVYVLACSAIGMMVNHLLATQLQGVDVHDDVFTWSYLGMLLLPSAVLVWWWRIPLDRVGLTFRGWRRSLADAAIATFAMVLLAVGLVVVARTTSLIPIHAPNPDILRKPEYLVHSYAQEFLARGLLQGSLQRFFDDGSGLVAVLLSSALFALLHIHFGFGAVALTFVSSVPLGLLYLRHENLLGVTLVHWMMGVVAFLSGLL